MNTLRLLQLFLLLLLPMIALAQPADLLISEYVEGSSNNKAIELYNGTGSAIDLAGGQYLIQMYFNGSSSVGLTVNLTGTIPAGGVFVVGNPSASQSILDVSNQTTASSAWYNGDDAVVLRKGGASGTILDVIGQVGTDPGTEWGTGNTSTADNTIRRKPASCTGDTNPSDAFDPTVLYNGFATDNIADLGSHSSTCGSDAALSVTSTTPASGATGVTVSANILIRFSENVTTTASSFAITQNGGGSVPFTATGGPQLFTLDPTSNLTSGAAYTVVINALQVSDQDSNDPPDTMAASYSFSFTVGTPANPTITKISTIQGSGLASSLTSQVVTIEGIVVGDFQAGDGDFTDLSGFYVQEEAADQDANSATSEGIFVFAPGATNVNAGDVVRVTGTVAEFGSSGSTLTELNNVSAITAQGTVSLPTPVDIALPVSPRSDLEHYEGMLVRFPQDLVISEFFNFDRFGEIVLAKPFDSLNRLFTPTSYVQPGSAAIQVAQQNALRQITLDDGRNDQNSDPARHPNGSDFTLNNRFRGGDIVRNTVGVLDEEFGLYRIQPTQGATYVPQNLRTTPPNVGGGLRISGANVLNFFLTLDAGQTNCGPGQNQGCRGANTSEEFQRQRNKILSELAAINADIFGLSELENTIGVDPLQNIVNGLNQILGPGTYAYIQTGTIGTDAIKVGIIYKPAVVMPIGNFAILNTAVDPRFIDTKNRPSLAQTFRHIGSGNVFTIDVNHLKSKGSDCNDVGDPNVGDGQENCNVTRTHAAQALVDWLATDPTHSGDPDFLIVGDLNSYDEEDPIRAIKAGADDTPGTGDDYVDLVERFQGEFSYSYLFDAQVGYLDYGLASSSFASQITGAAEWHNNADEPDLIDYDMTFKQPAQDSLYEPNAYRASDHDPVVIALGFGDAVLPVELAGFELAAIGSGAQADWRTASEVNNAGFELQRAGEQDTTFRPVVSYLTNPELAGLGTSSSGKHYTFLDPSLAPGLYSYRLVDISIDGVRTVHPAQSIRIEAESSVPVGSSALRLLPVTPNPATNAMQISFMLPETMMVTVALFDNEGRLVSTPIERRSYTAGFHQEKLTLDGLTAGGYTLQLRGGHGVRTQRFVVVR